MKLAQIDSGVVTAVLDANRTPPVNTWPGGRSFTVIPDGTRVEPGLTTYNGSVFTTGTANNPVDPRTTVMNLMNRIIVKIGSPAMVIRLQAIVTEVGA